MKLPGELNTRRLTGLVIIIMMGLLMYTGTVETEVGITVIIGVAAGLGIYEGKSGEEVK